jgi:uncharacterized membrane protein
MKISSLLSFLLIFTIVGMSSCDQFSANHPDTPDSLAAKRIRDTTIIVKDSIINARAFDTIPIGFYQGMLPCRTCEGIQRTIMFSADDRFKMEELEWGKGGQAKKTEGTWSKDNGRFVLYQGEKVIAKYKLVKDSLVNIENGGARIPDSLSKSYALFKKNTAPENPSWKKRKSEGVDIVGNGNDPFWSLEIDNEKFIYFKLTALAKPIIVPIEKPSINKDSTVYSIVTEGGAPLKVSISSKFCNDGVSDHLYEYKMNVWYKGQLYRGCAVLLNGEN